MYNKRWFYSLWALVAFGVWALHTATGFMDNLIAANSGKRSAVVGVLNSFTEASLVAPFGRPLAVALIIMTGFASAFWLYKMRGGSNPVSHQDESAPIEAKLGYEQDVQARLARYSQKAAPPNPALAVGGGPTNMAAGIEMSDQDATWVNEMLAVESDVLRSFFLERMKDEEISPDSVYLTLESEISHEDIARYHDQQISIQSRKKAAFDEAFGAQPLPLTLDLYSRLPASRRFSAKTPELRRLRATFDAALDCGWLLSLISQNPSLQGFNSTSYDWKQRLNWQKPCLHLSTSQISQALPVVGRLISSGFNTLDHIDEHWYGYIVRAAVADHWPRHRGDLIAMFSVGFNGRPQSHSNVLKLTELLLQETPLERNDIPELVEFDRVSAKYDAVRASVFAELGEPLAFAMDEVLDSVGGLLDTKRYPALRSLRKLSPERRGKLFAQLVTTISGLERHDFDHWEKLKRDKGRYRLGLIHDPEYSVQPEMSFLFSELTRKEIIIPDRDRTVSGFMDLLPFLIYLQDQETLDIVLYTAKLEPNGLTAAKLRSPLPKPTHHPFLPQFRQAIDDVASAADVNARF